MSQEISREALLIYLEDLRTFETIVYESDKKKRQIESEFCQKKEELLDSIGEKPILGAIPSWQVPSRESDASLLCSTILGIIVLLAGLSLIFLTIKIDMNMVSKGGGIMMGISLLIFGASSFYYGVSTKSEDKKAMENNARALRRAKEKHKLKLDEYHQKAGSVWGEITKIEDKANLIVKELDEEVTFAQEKLNEAYSINIIPLTFRNIQGIYYLYDYLSTSNQSLSEALMQCNLEAIKQKLDSAINLQGKAIIQQAQANHALFAQNQRILETAQATMNNTAVAAKYAQICAINSTVSLEMQKEQLAYQKVDFWLN